MLHVPTGQSVTHLLFTKYLDGAVHLMQSKRDDPKHSVQDSSQISHLYFHHLNIINKFIKLPISCNIFEHF